MKTSQSGESALLLLDVVKLLRDRKAQYAVIGALAASVHGAVRASMDADVVLSLGIPAGDSLDLELVRRLATQYGSEAAASLERLLAG